MQKVSEMTTEPVVGKFYLVPCVKSIYGNGFYPVIPVWHHEGAYAEKLPPHYHLDVRFFADDMLAYARREEGSRAQMTMGKISYLSKSVFDDFPISDRAITWRKLKCRRSMPEMLCPWFFEKLEKDFVGRKVLCGKCPHRQFPLESLPKYESGLVICNGHGLKIDMNKGEVVKRDA